MSRSQKHQKVPGKEEWAGYESDLDVKYAHRLMFGKTLDEVQDLFGGTHSIGRADELLFMPRRAFQYYVLAFAQYVMSPNAAGDSDSASAFLRLLVAREERDPDSLSQIVSALRPAIDYIAGNQGYFDADPNIYGSFADMGKRLHALCREAGSGD
jgi:hypothetical protein